MNTVFWLWFDISLLYTTLFLLVVLIELVSSLWLFLLLLLLIFSSVIKFVIVEYSFCILSCDIILILSFLFFFIWIFRPYYINLVVQSECFEIVSQSFTKLMFCSFQFRKELLISPVFVHIHRKLRNFTQKEYIFFVLRFFCLSFSFNFCFLTLCGLLSLF